MTRATEPTVAILCDHQVVPREASQPSSEVTRSAELERPAPVRDPWKESNDEDSIEPGIEPNAHTASVSFAMSAYCTHPSVCVMKVAPYGTVF